MKLKLINKCMLVATIACLAACNKNLDRTPLNSTTSDIQYSTADGYKQVLAKVYGAYSLTSSGGTGQADVTIPGVTDVAVTDFVRANWNLQELSTDEGVCAWNDSYLQNLHNLNWTSSNFYISAMYYRSLYQITICNEMIRQASEAEISSRGFTGADAVNIRHYRAEARFLRAYQYTMLMDMFGNPPIVTENDPIGKYIPKRILRKDLFNYVESELKAIDTALVAPRLNEYGRADQGADWALLARIYLNANVYTGTARYTDAMTYASKVINAGYALLPKYANLFKADNNLNNTEVILPVAYDAVNSQNYGGTTFLICSAHGTNATDDKSVGIPGGGWLGNRSTQNLPLVFGDYSGKTDKRAMFGLGQLQINSVLNFTDGLGVSKFSNQNSDGTTPYSPNGVLVNTDFPLFRLAEMFLIYIEAEKRGGTGGNDAIALAYFNNLRARAYGNTSGNVTTFSLDDILNERQRELYWEGFRRTDLIRYNYFTSATYLWPWKASVSAGTGVDAHFNLFPIPAAEIQTNTNLVQNPGY